MKMMRYFNEAAFDWLNGDFVAQGKLPVTVCDAFHYGDGITDYGLEKLPQAKPAEAGFR